MKQTEQELIVEFLVVWKLKRGCFEGTHTDLCTFSENKTRIFFNLIKT